MKVSAIPHIIGKIFMFSKIDRLATVQLLG